MTHALNVAVNDALRQRELLVRGLVFAQADRDDGQAAQLEHLLEMLDGLLAMVTFNEGRH